MQSGQSAPCSSIWHVQFSNIPCCVWLPKALALACPTHPHPNRAHAGFGVFYGVFTSQAAAWCLMSLFQLILGAAMALVALPSTCLYAPLVRTTGFSFGYNCGYGVIGGLTPIIVTAIRTALPESMRVYASPLWLLATGALSLVGCLLMHFFRPRINQNFVGHIE